MKISDLKSFGGWKLFYWTDEDAVKLINQLNEDLKTDELHINRYYRLRNRVEKDLNKKL